MSDLFGNHIVGFPTRWLIRYYGDKTNIQYQYTSQSVCTILKLFEKEVDVHVLEHVRLLEQIWYFMSNVTTENSF